ncbi:MAG: DNA alkylation repair protein [Methanomassiliicoccales archaeon]|nr:DNA alkylation repair protein [Methanomassiliicoccales archaeon]
MKADEVIGRLRSLADPGRREGMSRYGIPVAQALGVSIPQLRTLGKDIGKDHALAGALFDSGIHEAMVLACFVDEPKRVTEEQMDAWVVRFDSWDLCDQCCNDLFRRTPYAWKKALEWSEREEEFVKRAGFTLMAVLAVHDRISADNDFGKFLKAVEEHSSDGRNYVKKAVNWALRQIGKRNSTLNAEAIRSSERIRARGDPSSKWVASDALKELRSETVQERLKNRGA